MTQLEKLRALVRRFNITLTAAQRKAIEGMSPLPKYQISHDADPTMCDRRMEWARVLPGVWGFRIAPRWAIFIIRQDERFL